MKEIKDSLNKSRDAPYSWIKSLNIIKQAILKKLSADLMQFQPIPAGFFFLVNANKLIIKFILKGKGARIARNIFDKEE